MNDRLHSFTLGDVARENARNFPTRTAVICGGDRLTYAALEERVNQTATVLAEAGVSPNDRVAWLGFNCHGLLEAMLACVKLGAIAAPINWRLSQTEVEALLRYAQPSLALVNGASDQTLNAVDSVLSPASAIDVTSSLYQARVSDAEPRDHTADQQDDHPALLLMTGYFQGKPRGALLTSRSIVTQNLVMAGVGAIDVDSEIYLCCAPMFHIGGLLKMFALLQWGGTIVIAPRAEAGEISQLIEQERCTSGLILGPTMEQLVEINGNGKYDLTSFRDSMGGVPADDYADAWYAMTSCTRGGVRASSGYGATETVGMVTFEGRGPRGLGAFGRPSPAVALRIMDPDGNEVPTGEIGEIAVRGPQVMAGYLGEAPLDLSGWRMTGDLGSREPDGTIAFLGPKQEFIKSGMENIYPVEIESALLQHPDITGACVFGVPDPKWGQSVRAVVELRADAHLSDAELEAFLVERIARYKRPRSISYIDSLPRTGSGIIDRQAVKSTYGDERSHP